MHNYFLLWKVSHSLTFAMINVNAFLVAESLLDMRQACTMFLSFIEMLSRYSLGNMLKFASCEQRLK